MICDEVMSGFGRTGEWFAVDHWNVVPDIITMAKGLTSAYVPLGAVGCGGRLPSTSDERVYGGLTYNRHPMACAAALATIDVYEEDELIENARRMGVVMRELLESSERSTPPSARSRSIGLFGIVELVRRPGDAGADGAVQRHLGGDGRARRGFRENGLYTFVRWNKFFTNPPLCVTEAELQRGVRKSSTRGWRSPIEPSPRTYSSPASSETNRRARRRGTPTSRRRKAARHQACDCSGSTATGKSRGPWRRRGTRPSGPSIPAGACLDSSAMPAATPNAVTRVRVVKLLSPEMVPAPT